MGGVASTHNCPPQSPVPPGKIRICVAGTTMSPFAGRAHQIANYLANSYPDKFESWFHWDAKGCYFRYIIDTFEKVPFRTSVKGHSRIPLVWLEVAKSEATGASADPKNHIDEHNAILEVIGGRDKFQSWVKRHTLKADGGGAVDPTVVALTKEEIDAKVATVPDDAMYFKQTEELMKICEGVGWYADWNHGDTYGPMTAAAATTAAAGTGTDTASTENVATAEAS